MLRNRIVTMPSPRMTTHDSFKCQKRTFQRTMFFDCFKCIFRTGGSKPATCRRHWRNAISIKINREQEDLGEKLFHNYSWINILEDNIFNACFIAVSISEKLFSSCDKYKKAIEIYFEKPPSVPSKGA